MTTTPGESATEETRLAVIENQVQALQEGQARILVILDAMQQDSNNRDAATNARFDALQQHTDTRIDALQQHTDTRFDARMQRFDALQQHTDARIDTLLQHTDTRFDAMQQHRQRSRLILVLCIRDDSSRLTNARHATGRQRSRCCY